MSCVSSVVLVWKPAYHGAADQTTRRGSPAATLAGGKRFNAFRHSQRSRNLARQGCSHRSLRVPDRQLRDLGIGDIFRGYGANSVASVGRTEIGAENFRRAFQQRVAEIQQRSRGFTGEQARLIGLDRQVLNQMIGEAALDDEARRLGLAIAPEEVARQLTNIPAFKSSEGRFNRLAFDAYLREVGLSEGAFIQQQRLVTLRQQLGETVTGGLSAPQAMLEMLHRYRAEERTISYITVPARSPPPCPLRPRSSSRRCMTSARRPSARPSTASSSRSC